MKMRKTFLILIAIIVIFSCSMVIYAKMRFKHVNYADLFDNTVYNYIGSNNSKNKTLEMTYEQDLGLNDYFIDKEINTFEDLKRYSDYILIVSNSAEPVLVANGIINQCTILKIIKGSNLNVNDVINIYDLVYSWNNLSVNYINGNTPLKIGDEYVVFLKKTHNSSIKDSYVFASTMYGRVSILKQRGIFKNYQYGMSSPSAMSEYDFVFSSDASTEIMSYQKMVAEIRKFANENRE